MIDKGLEQIYQLFTRSKRNTENIIKTAPLGICVTDPDGHFEMVNAAYCNFYGYTEEELLGKHFTLMVSPANRDQLTTLHDEFIKGDSNQELRQEWEVHGRQGDVYTIIAEAARIEGDDGRPRKVTFIVDITERKQLEERLKKANERLDHLAHHDELTGLFNRRAGLQRLEEEQQRSKRYGNALSIAIFDLDSFKAINDTYGHGIGDDALREVTELVGQTLRSTDIQVRLGGEEFLIIMPEVETQAAKRAMQRVCEAIASARFTSQQIRVTVSTGVACYAETTHRCILDRADDAMYKAKEAGGNGVVIA
ncbi:PAS domain S-box-containing protein/diguanylate cyclase (GGDEF)-like protein [Vreelandella songnenensis]|uniref:diguanylate cyclase n=1 Tax=Vreelandella songnenensis TaxID=1176243 RepID=A0A2T0V4X5_9GAMM|nr:sensor domain-containing diguanylate cyclase [Halomonas songnenensis]PRY65118.1 PAS domain S-box-containing protein/diguanylate cyclase (GGDEF)-like protein [Halomonas songnenensis]